MKAAVSPSRRRSTQAHRGVAALPAALVLLVLALIVGAAITGAAGLEAAIAQRRLITAHTLAVADGCLDHVVARLPAGWTFSGALLGPDGVAGSADDGTFSAPAACRVTGRLHGDGLRLSATGSTAQGRRTVEAVVAWEAAPGIATPLWATSVASVGTVDAPVSLDAMPAAEPAVALAAPALPADLDAWLAAHPLVSQSGRMHPPAYAPAPPLHELFLRALSIGAPVFVATAAAPPPRQVTAVDGDLLIGVPTDAAGILVVRGALHVAAPLRFRGVLAVLGGVSSDPAASLTVSGALWLGDGSSGSRLAGPTNLTYDAAAVAEAEGLLPLPRRPTVLSIRDRET